MPDNSDSDLRKEVELVLMIVSRDPRTVAQKIAMLDSIAGYPLSRQPTRLMRDVYFDTEDGRLKRRRLNLRVRSVDGAYWLTMKKSPGAFSFRRSEREELEIPWSESSLGRILKEFSSQGVELKSPSFAGESDPVAVLKSTGLSVIQDRETRREACDVLSETGERPPLAELVVDSVQYNLAKQTVSLCEVEIEAKASGGRTVLERVRTALIERFGVDLRPWKPGKLMTGKAVTKLLEKGELEGLIEDGYLKPEAFEKIDQAAS